MKSRLLFLLFYTFLIFNFTNTALALDKENKTDNFLVISDIHLNGFSDNKMDINPAKVDSKNDLDFHTFQTLIANIDNHIKSGLISTPKFIIIQGDLVGHGESTHQNRVDSQAVVFSTLTRTFPQTPVFYIFGNNDSLVSDYGDFKNLTHTDNETVKSPFDVAKSDGAWKDGFLSTGNICTQDNNAYPCLINENTTQGYYTAAIAPHFELIALNSVLFSPRSKNTDDTAASDQLEWLARQLKDAEQNNTSVLLVMHIPPGNNIYDHSPFWRAKEQTLFLNTVKQYQNNIKGILVSHTHSEEMKVLKDKLNHIIGGIYFTAGLSTSHGNAPSVKTFYYAQQNDKSNNNWALTNFTAFNFALDNNQQLLLKALYNYQDNYCQGNNNNANLFKCLSNITPEKIKNYLSAGNPAYAGVMKFPEDIILDL